MAEIGKKTSSSLYQIEPAKSALPTLYVGMVLFLISEVFLFGALFWTYYYLRANSPVWPPQGVHLTMELAIANTAVLLASSGTIWWATFAIKRKSRKGLAAGIGLTLILGLTFLSITGWEWTHETFRPWSDAYGSIFYTLTGFHALHVFGGVVLMLFLLIRTLRNRFSATDFLPVEVGSLYWHFVDFIWLIVFTTLFIVR
jgi:cytochrome c oxidase subunit 3